MARRGGGGKLQGGGKNAIPKGGHKNDKGNVHRSNTNNGMSKGGHY